MTSVKEFRVQHDPTPDEPGLGRFVFTDAYSVFDWGRMPDRIPAKGASLCMMGAFNFELLEAAGVPTHYRGIGSDSARLDDRNAPARELVIDIVDVPDLPFDAGHYDYDAFHNTAGRAYLIPLEIVFRNHVPVGSSLRTRTAPSDHGLEVDSWPAEPVELPSPVVEFSTKFEEQDRYLSREEADRIAGAADLADLETLAHRVNDLITDHAAAAGFTHEDGKIECLYVDGEIRVADVVGTFDENRFAYDGQEVSKEVLRQFYKHEHADWVDAVRTAKARANREGIADWRGLCPRAPPTLPTSVVDLTSDLFTAGTNAYTGRSWFEAPTIDEAVAAVRDL